MKIALSKYAGFCDGVERAYTIINEIARDKSVKRPIYVLGSLVHNEDVVKKIEKLGVKKIHVDKNIFTDLKNMKDSIGTLVITAHGMGPKIYDFCKKFDIPFIDTTCPRVIKVQRLAKLFLERGYQIVIVGERDHKEVKGIYEWAKRQAVFVESEKDFKKLKLNPKQKIAVISQTTQNQEFVKRAQKYIQDRYPQVEIVDTICLATQSRQTEIKKMAKQHAAVVVIGSPESANSNRLLEIARECNPQSYFVERASQLKKNWFKDVKSIGVTAGASTPKWIIKKVVEKLQRA